MHQIYMTVPVSWLRPHLHSEKLVRPTGVINEEKNSNLMVYLKSLNGTNHSNYGFDSLCGTELKVSLNAIFSGNPSRHSVTIMHRINVAY